MFHSTSLTMMNDGHETHWVPRAALPVSFALHLVVIALLVFGLPVSLATPQKEDAISVDLVPPPKPAEKAEAQPKPVEKPAEPKEAKAESPPPAAAKAAAAETPSAFRPVVRFGEKDSGPRRSPDGHGAEDRPATPETADAPDERDVAKTPPITLNELTTTARAPDAEARPAPKPTRAAEAPKPPRLQEAKTLFSTEATSNPDVMTAMRNTPRDIRAGQLCLTELRQQLLHAEPAYRADLLPTDSLKDGSTAIDIADAAFRADLQWYHLGYRCEVDGEAMKVVSFAFRVGSPIPRDEWARRGLPAQ